MRLHLLAAPRYGELEHYTYTTEQYGEYLRDRVKFMKYSEYEWVGGFYGIELSVPTVKEIIESGDPEELWDEDE
jgi:hypothetical protein